MRTITPSEIQSVTYGPDGAGYLMRDYLGSHAAKQSGEQAYLVEQQAGELRAHFHEVDQFQVVVGGAGTIGRDRAVPGVVHYTDAYASYGPICTDPEVGISYLTLRRDPTTGINYMPEEREKRRRLAGCGEHFTVLLDERVAVGAGLVELGGSGRGARAYGVRLAPGEPLCLVDLPAGQAGYAVVLAGAMIADGRPLPAGSLVSFEGVAEVAGLSAGPEEVEVAVALFAPSR
ncbi:hypothetical protein GHK92_19455 [Nocardioides sp. dk4132]|uniref:hypothetical protein n=1 Tax=unclassified Nocardioides TaxID=2615069 RepID=UPI0012970179|nr:MULTISPECIES: hypothetical protein [unclassified Nocardioides]MQW78049.1 hypothetical protein [Nocardioides sp. dk4132]QGA08152.1 hypothetical protein GFH29_12635 [Nocardioides sp. dk884]